MLTRRQLLEGSVAVAVGHACTRVLAAQTKEELCRYVDPFIGTGGHGHTFPGATLPFGMVQLSPDTDVARGDACSGDHYEDGAILGGSQRQLRGTGSGD